MISRDSIQQVTANIDIIDIVSEFVRLKRRGANYLGLCPFHDERTPSFTVSPTKEIYKCFGCGRSGNAITFLMEHEKYSYVEAIRWLANRYGIELEETETSPEYKQQQETAESLHIINSFAQKYFNNTLLSNGEGINTGKSYLKQRGLRDNTINDYGIGYCPKDNSFTKAAIEKQFNKELLVKSGLVVHRNGQYADNYSGRIIFPIHNQTGKVVGFGARQIENNKKSPKYINTPENEIYVKNKILYGLWQARQSISKKNECILVEGYMDVVSLHQSGITNIVASSGTSLTSNQVSLIHKFTPNLTIFYDGDEAGIAAAMRGINIALEEGLNVKIVSLPPPEDPDSYIQKYGAAALEKYLEENKKDFILFQLDRTLEQAGNDTHKKSEAIQKIAESISKLSRPEDFVIKQDYIRRVAARLNIDEEGLISLINSIVREDLKQKQRSFARDQKQKQEFPQEPLLSTTEDDEDNDLLLLPSKDHLEIERELVRCLLEFGSREWESEVTIAKYLLQEIHIETLLTDDGLNSVVNHYHELLNEDKKPEIRDFLYTHDTKLNKIVASLIASPYEVSKNWKEKYHQEVPLKEDLYLANLTSILRNIQLAHIRKLIEENGKEIARESSEEKLKILIETHQQLKRSELEWGSQIGMAIKK